MIRTYIKDIHSKIGEQVLLKGFVQTLRKQGSIAFIILRDVTGTIQCVVIKNNEKAFTTAKDLTVESVISLTGLAKEEKQAPGGFEVQVEDLEVLSKAEPELPIPVVYEKSGEETDQPLRFDWRWLDLRKEERLKIFKVWTEFEKGVRTYTQDNSYIQIYTPSFMNTPSESGAEVFEVNYFDRKAYLAQSPQFYKQMAMASGLEKVFIAGPVFRAEPSYTTRHMTEFTGWDIEISYIDSHHDVMDELEKMFVSGFEQVKATLLPELEIPTMPFPRLTMKEVKKLLAERNIPSEREFDISAEEERALQDIVKEKYNHDFVFVIDWPVEVRPFYHMRHENDATLTKSADLLYKGLEIVTLAQREHRVDQLEKQAQEKSMELEPLKNYINFFRYGCPPHGGAGIGPGRIIMRMLDMPSVKEVTFLPRDVKRLTP
jgi:aspartyl-tRNA synthetase